jgi:preprotein translocase subunit SecG
MGEIYRNKFAPLILFSAIMVLALIFLIILLCLNYINTAFMIG